MEAQSLRLVSDMDLQIPFRSGEDLFGALIFVVTVILVVVVLDMDISLYSSPFRAPGRTSN